MASQSSSMEDKSNSLKNAQPFDLHKTSKAQNVEEVAKVIYEQCVYRRHGPKFTKVADVIISVLINLLAARKQDEARYVRFSRRNGRYKKGRYNPLSIGSTNLITVVDAMHDAGLVELHKGIPAPEGFKGGRQSRMRATAQLVELLDRFGVVPAMIESATDEVIILRGFKDADGYAEQIDYRDCPKVDTMRRNLELINKRIAEIDSGIDIQLSHEQMDEMKEHLVMHPDKEPIDWSRIRLRRIFNNESFEQGGRFYHGWWQNIPRRYRSWIQINGRVTQEVDYSAIHFAIFYAEVGMQLDSDPYKLPRAEKADRDIIKKALNAAINASELKEAERAIRKESIFSYELPEAYPTAKQLLDALIKRHKHIKDYIGTGAGRRAQYIDSKIAEQVMLSLGNKGIVVLPVHDSFIVEEDRVEELMSAMNQAFQDIVQAECGVEVKTPAWMEPEFDGPSPVDFREKWPEMDFRDSSKKQDQDQDGT